MVEETCQVTRGIDLINLARRQTTGDSTLNEFINLIKTPFQQQFQSNSFFASFGVSVGVSALIFLAWCFVRPYHSLVYAPKLRHADEKHAPPPVAKGFFSWLQPLIKCHEVDLVDRIGMDAVLFLRFMRMCRTIFFWLAILGCAVMIPVNVRCNLRGNVKWDGKSWFMFMTPQYNGNCMWAQVVIAWIFDLTVMFFLWRNYKDVVRLRRNYFESPEYIDSLHSRTLLISDIPSSYRSDAGLNKLVGGLPVPSTGDEKCAIGRNVKDLPGLVAKHDTMVRRVEKILSKYLKNPDLLPPRPMCKPDKDDKSVSQDAKVDAIQYHKNRIEELEREIMEVRNSIDKRNATQYGFVSYATISRAHITAKAAKGKHPKGTSITLATKSNDLLWDNLEKVKGRRRWNSFIGNLLFVALSVFFVVPNALIAVFLSNFNNIGLVSSWFDTVLKANSSLFSVIQGVLAPTVTSIIYLVLPHIMRGLCNWQGDFTKTSRERHVTHKLYIFFVFNNLVVFTLFSSIWAIVYQFVNDVKVNDKLSWGMIQNLNIGDTFTWAIFQVSTYWVTYLLGRNMGAMLDLIQLVSLVGKSLSTRFGSPTPRERIEWTAPPPFDYATYYNNFLFYATVALTFATIQPLVLPVVFLYFGVDSFMKKYALMYVFVTKVESGGAFWRVLFNRFLFALIFFNLVVALIVWVRLSRTAAACIAPLLIIIIVFKFYCRRTFDPAIQFHTKGSDRESMISAGKFKRKDNLDKRYGHPALYQRLIKPMVAGKAEHLMAEVYGGVSDPALKTQKGGINMDNMQRGQAGKKAKPLAGFEVVQEQDMDFAHFKHRAEFGEDHGFDTFSETSSIALPGLPSSSRPGSPAFSRMGAHSPSPLGPGMGYRGTDYMPVSGITPQRGVPPTLGSPYMEPAEFDFSHHDNRSETESLTHLLGEQQGPPVSTPGGPAYNHQPPQWEQRPSYDTSYDEYRGAHR